MAAPMQTNAADPRQLRHAERKQKQQRERELADIRFVMSSAEGRRFNWSRLAKLGVFGSIWHPSALIHYNAGKQDAGHELMADLLEASEELYLTMEREMRTFARRELNEAEAVRTNGAQNDGN